MSTQVGQILKREFANRRRTGGGRLSSLCIQTEPSSNVVHRTCLPSSTAIRLEPQIGLSLMNDTPASEEIVMRLAHSLILRRGEPSGERVSESPDGFCSNRAHAFSNCAYR